MHSIYYEKGNFAPMKVTACLGGVGESSCLEWVCTTAKNPLQSQKLQNGFFFLSPSGDDFELAAQRGGDL